VEEQFYVLFPLILYLWLQREAIRAKSGFLISFLLPALTIISLVYSAYETHTAQLHAFYLLPSRLWELAAGALLFQLHSQGRFKAHTAAHTNWSMLSGLLLMVCGFVFSEASQFPFPWALLPVIGTCLLLMGTTSGHAEGLALQKLLQSGAMVYIGRISYSLYLWHWPVFSLFRWTVGLTQPANIAIALGLTFGLSAFSYRYIETPIRTSNFLRKEADWKIVSWGVVTVSVAFICAAALLKYDDSIGISQSVTTDKCSWNAWLMDGCATPALEEPILNASGRQVFALGDSHTGAYTSMLRLAEKLTGAKIYIKGAAGCGIAYLSKPSGDDSCVGDQLKWLAKKAKPGDIVFLASLRVPRLADHVKAFDEEQIRESISGPTALKEQQAGFREAVDIIEELQAMGLHVLIEAPKPLFRAPPYRCSDWFNRSNPVCQGGFAEDRTFLLAHRKGVMEAIGKLQQSHNISVWDPFPLLCDGPACSAFDQEQPLFVDADHVSGYANRLLLPHFIEKLEKIWQQEKSTLAKTKEKGAQPL
jgi:hypothetical protein